MKSGALRQLSFFMFALFFLFRSIQSSEIAMNLWALLSVSFSRYWFLNNFFSLYVFSDELRFPQSEFLSSLLNFLVISCSMHVQCDFVILFTTFQNHVCRCIGTNVTMCLCVGF